MEPWELAILILSIYCSIEILLYFWTRFVRRRFQWLITNTDEKPTLSKEGLEKFFEHGYDKELGWVRKPNTAHDEVGKFGPTKWTINQKGCRTNPNFDELESTISCYGDSFAFCRQVNDDETWEHYLSELQKTNVLNFGVGNYGLDQSILRLQREFPKNKTKTVILGVVPDTISRIMSLWKHYYEYGNTFAFKPRFVLEGGNLKLIKNKIDDESKFLTYKSFLDEIKQVDFFYEKKFKKEKVFFPYSFTLLKNIQRNTWIFFWVTSIHIAKKLKIDTKNIEWFPMQKIMRINLRWRIMLYNLEEPSHLMKKLVEEFASYSKEQQFTPVFVFIPQKDDLIFIKTKFHFYKKFISEISQIQGLYFIDLVQPLLGVHDLDELYSDDNEYGGHLSKIGNKKVAEIIHVELQKMGISNS